MREILFRGKRTDNGEWVYGFYVRLGDNLHYILTGKLDITKIIPQFVHYEVTVIVLIIAIIITKTIVEADIPMWLKFFLLK